MDPTMINPRTASRRILNQMGIYAWGEPRPARNDGPWWGPNATVAQEPGTVLITGRPGMGKGFHAKPNATRPKADSTHLGTIPSR
jgi:hypothetical protein